MKDAQKPLEKLLSDISEGKALSATLTVFEPGKGTVQYSAKLPEKSETIAPK